MTDDPYPLIDGYRLYQSGHSYFEVHKGQSPGLFEQVSRSEVVCVLVCAVSLTYVYYWMSEKKRLAELLSLKEVGTLAFSIFI